MSRNKGIRDVSLVDNKEFLQSVYNALPCGIGIYTVSANPEILFLNSGYLKIYGFDGGMDYSVYDQYTQNDFFVDVLPEERAIVEAAFKRRLSSDKPVVYDAKALCRDGSIRFTRCTLDMINLPTGESYFQEIIVDITEEKIEERSRELNKYSRSLMAVFDRICEVNLASNTIMPISSKAPDQERLKSITNCQVYFLHQAEKYVHPEDKDTFLRFTEFRNIRETVERDGYAYAEYRSRLVPEGDYQYTSLTMMPVEDDYYLYCVMNIDSRIKHKLLEQENKFLQEKAERDPLTSLLNRTATENAVERFLFHCGPNSSCAMIVLDLDDFKKINDTYGHLKGDRILIRVAEILQKLTRKGDVVGRFGGDEFVVFLSDAPNEEVITRKVQEFAEEIRKLAQELSISEPVSASFGITLSNREGAGFMDLFHDADRALYIAKRQGKDKFAVV